MDVEGKTFLGTSGRDDIVAAIRAIALSHGVTEEEFDQAIADNSLDLLVVDRVMLHAARMMTGEEVSEQSGISLEKADRLWRALGFPEAGGAPVFNEQDVEALRTIGGLAQLGLSSDESSVQVTRVLGQSMSRLADALVASVDAALHEIGRPEWATATEDDRILLAEALAFSSEVVFPSMEKLILYAWRRHIQAAARRRASMGRDGSLESSMLTRLTVGFADMVGFTALSSQLTAEALARVVDRFEDLAHTTVVNGGGRPVKMIGDEVMFVTTDPLAAVRIGLSLVEAYADDELLSDVRVGVATGPVLMREGDFFGSVVNRAHRTVAIADAGTVLAGDEVRAEITARRSDGAQDLEWEALKPRELKDIGRVTLWHVRQAGTGTSEERRSGHRWRRLSNITAELAILRERGERAIGAMGTAGPGGGGPAADGSHG